MYPVPSGTKRSYHPDHDQQILQLYTRPSAICGSINLIPVPTYPYSYPVRSKREGSGLALLHLGRSLANVRQVSRLIDSYES
eukprot:1172782-Rhodomonas_salina.1